MYVDSERGQFHEVSQVPGTKVRDIDQTRGVRQVHGQEEHADEMNFEGCKDGMENGTRVHVQVRA